MKPCARIARTWSSLLLVLPVGCASLPVEGSLEAALDPGRAPTQEAAVAAPQEQADKKETEAQRARKRRGIERKLRVAQSRLELARLKADSGAREMEDKLRKAAAEVEGAEAKLELFALTRANRLASSELGLRSTRDRAQEAEDELAQIEIMYKDQDLDDLTAEFVVSRGRRNAERARARIAIQEAEHQALENHELPQEQRTLSLALMNAKAALAQLSHENKIGEQSQAIALMEAEHAIAGLREEIEALDEAPESEEDQ